MGCERLLAGLDRSAGVVADQVHCAAVDALGSLHPVRSSAQAAARQALASGRVIVVYPEGTVTRDPEGWPMTARTGAVRLALQTGAPLVPVGQWGIQELLPYGGRAPRPFPRKTARIRIGAPVDLDDLRGAPMTASGLRAGTERMMDAITAIVADLRGEPAPAGRWDPRTGRREPGA